MDYAEQQWTELLELHDELQSKRSTTEVSSLRAFRTHLVAAAQQKHGIEDAKLK
jgi:hypothetical protein